VAMLIRRTLAKPSGHLLMRLTLENKRAWVAQNVVFSICQLCRVSVGFGTPLIARLGRG